MSRKNFRASVASEAEHIIYNTFPTKVSDSRPLLTHSSPYPRYCNYPASIASRCSRPTASGRELQKRIDGIDTPSSIYSLLRIDAMADATIYTPNRDSDQVDIKKRKRGLDGEIINGHGADGNAGNGAVYTGQVKTNAHLRIIHAELKAECEELGNLCVGFTLR